MLGKSGKEPHMVFSKAKEECYIGGSSIIANHVSDFVNTITLISDFSPDNEIKNILNKMLKKNIKHKIRHLRGMEIKHLQSIKCFYHG